MEEYKNLIWALSLIILVSAILVSFAYAAETSEQTTPSNVTVNKYVAIGLSDNLSYGIQFGAVDMNTNNNNATANYDGGNNNSTYYINVSSDGNVNIDICIRDNWALNTSANDVIENGNYTWADNRTANSTFMNATDGSYAISTTYQKTNETILTPGTMDYFRFWLDIAAAQPAGTYNNTMYFKGVEASVACGS